MGEHTFNDIALAFMAMLNDINSIRLKTSAIQKRAYSIPDKCIYIKLTLML